MGFKASSNIKFCPGKPSLLATPMDIVIMDTVIIWT